MYGFSQRRQKLTAEKLTFCGGFVGPLEAESQRLCVCVCLVVWVGGLGWVGLGGGGGGGFIKRPARQRWLLYVLPASPAGKAAKDYKGVRPSTRPPQLLEVVRQ
jgi:hypothetical protein